MVLASRQAGLVASLLWTRSTDRGTVKRFDLKQCVQHLPGRSNVPIDAVAPAQSRHLLSIRFGSYSIGRRSYGQLLESPFMTHHNSLVVCRLDQQLPLGRYLHGWQVILKPLRVAAGPRDNAFSTINADTDTEDVIEFIIAS